MNKQKGQAATEYAVLVAFIVGVGVVASSWALNKLELFLSGI